MHGHRSRHVDHGAFGGRVEQVGGPAADPGDRAHVYDGAGVATLFFGGGVTEHGGNGIFGHQDHGGDVDFHGLDPSGHIDVDGGARGAADADVVDEDVEAGEVGESGVDDVLAGGGGCDVGGEGEGVADGGGVGGCGAVGVDHGDCAFSQ